MLKFAMKFFIITDLFELIDYPVSLSLLSIVFQISRYFYNTARARLGHVIKYSTTYMNSTCEIPSNVT